MSWLTWILIAVAVIGFWLSWREITKIRGDRASR
jgi:hypothetical protein